jgi:Tol biopolymer transport system component
MRRVGVVALVGVISALVLITAWRSSHAVPSAAPPIAQIQQVGDRRVLLWLDQALPGERLLDISAQDAAGRPMALSAVRLRFTMTEMAMPSSEVEAKPSDRGHFQARGPFFSMAGPWAVDATLIPMTSPVLHVRFTVTIAAQIPASAVPNPAAPAAAALAGQALYQANCASCHGVAGRGDGAAAAGLNPRPADLAQHMRPGYHTDAEVFQWIKNGYPGTAMPAWGSQLTDAQIASLVTYLRTFAQTPAIMRQAPGGPSRLPLLIFVYQGNLWRSDRSAATPQQLTHLPSRSAAWHPAVSPDHRSVAFVVETAPTDPAQTIPGGALCVMRLDGSELRTVWQTTNGLPRQPSWTPDGQTLYVSFNGVQVLPGTSELAPLRQIVRVDLATGARQTVVQEALEPALSPDGGLLAYRSLRQGDGGTLVVATPDGSNEQTVVDGQPFVQIFAPRFSPDGTRLIFAANGGPMTDGQGYPVKALGRSALQHALSLLDPPVAEAHGQQVDLWMVKTDGTGLRRLTWFAAGLLAAAFSPDGKQIAVMSASGIYLIGIDGSGLQQMSSFGDQAGGIDWIDP